MGPADALHRVTIRHDVRVPVRDGITLSANLFMPAAADDRAAESGADDRAQEPAVRRFPAILEMIPYRKDDWRYAADVARGTYLAERGYVLCRLDVRGTGSSDGIALDEYTEAETLDGYDAVEWLAAQPWCTGSVGMWGISYGGFTSIQVSALRPPHLRAIVPVYATDDRYTDDVHYIGGCMTVSELSQYAVSQVAMNALPPRPAYAGPGWQDLWRERLEATPIWLFEWARRQRDGPYWRRGSLAPDYGRIMAPMLLIGGWMDGYVDAALRMLERCVRAPRRAIVGNWVHAWPDDAYPGPTIDWLGEVMRFFDHWLRGADNGADREPALTWFQREYAPPDPFPAEWPGRWRAAEAFPVPGTHPRELYLEGGHEPLRGRLTADPPDAPGSDAFAHHPTTGTRGSLSWGAGHPPNGLARDLRPDEGWGPTYASEPLAEPLDIAGMPEAVLHVASSAAVAHLVVRLADVAPDGSSLQVAAGILNLTHRASHEHPEAIEPGRVYEVSVPMRAAGYRFAPGHRIRLDVASAWWPVIWPSPSACEIEIHRGPAHASRLVLPAVPPDDRLPQPSFAPRGEPLAEVGSETADPPVWRITDDVIAGTVAVETLDAGTSTLPDGTRLFISEALTMTAWEREPGRARFENTCVYRLDQDGAHVDVEACGVTEAGPEAFDMDVRLDVRLDGRPFHERHCREVIPRDMV